MVVFAFRVGATKREMGHCEQTCTRIAMAAVPASDIVRVV